MARPQRTRSQKAPPQKVRADASARLVEWATGLVSAVIVILVIGWVAWEAFTEVDTSPAFETTITHRQAVDGGYRVSFDIANTSPQTASTVVVRGEIVDGETIIEYADITFDYVPGRSSASGSFFFSHDPGAQAIRLRAIGFTKP